MPYRSTTHTRVHTRYLQSIHPTTHTRVYTRVPPEYIPYYGYIPYYSYSGVYTGIPKVCTLQLILGYIPEYP